MIAIMSINTQAGVMAQQPEPLTPEKLWELARVSAEGLSADGGTLIYGVGQYDIKEDKLHKDLFTLDVKSKQVSSFFKGQGNASVVQVLKDGTVLYLLDGQLWSQSLGETSGKKLTDVEGGLQNVVLSPKGDKILFSRRVLVDKVHSKDKYEELPLSNEYLYDDVDYRHWDTFNAGKYAHPFLATYKDGEIGEAIDLLEGKPFYSPQAPFGGAEDFAWTPEGDAVLYVTKTLTGKDYAFQTNTDIYRYDINSKETINLTEGMMGYDTSPGFSPNGRYMSFLSMETNGFEADKNDLVLYDRDAKIRLNVTGHWDGTVNNYYWSKDSRRVYFTAPVQGTIQIFEVQVPKNFRARSLPLLRQVSSGQFDINSIIGESENGLVVMSNTMTRAAEAHLYTEKNNTLTPLTTVNDHHYAQIIENKVEGRFTKASDGKDLFSWVVYPTDFDSNKKYPTLLYCQGGPQSPLSQFYSLRWNLQLIASQGYSVIAPNRRGMPGWGQEWNDAISEDWGGQPIQDYLAAIDDIAKESYVDQDRLGAIGASYGGYSVFMLAGVHQGRFKTFISHCGLFNMESWYGTTEEMFFAKHDIGGAYFENPEHPSYNAFNPSRHVNNWDTPILIFQGGKDYRVPKSQAFEAFQSARLKGLKSRLVFLPDENHWVLSGQNAQVWQSEFFRWVGETL